MHFINKVVLLLTVVALSADEYLPTHDLKEFEELRSETITILEKVDPDIDPDLGFNFKEYSKIIESKESGGDPRAISCSRMYVGLYQIGDLALKEIGMENISVRKFIKNPDIFPKDIQLLALKKLALANEAYLKTEIQRFDGKVVHGYKITKAGLLGAAHHVGFTRVKTFLYTGNVGRDGNGIKMTTFIKKMNYL